MLQNSGGFLGRMSIGQLVVFTAESVQTATRHRGLQPMAGGGKGT